jgi:hypothetical protein
MDKIAAYEMLLAEHPLWTEDHEKVAILGFKQFGQGLQQVGTGIKSMIKPFRSPFEAAALKPMTRPPTISQRLRGFKYDMNKRVGQGMVDAYQGLNRMSQTPFGQFLKNQAMPPGM